MCENFSQQLSLFVEEKIGDGRQIYFPRNMGMPFSMQSGGSFDFKIPHLGKKVSSEAVS